MEQLANAPLARYTTLKIGGEADRLCMPASAEELADLLDRLKRETQEWHVLGGGSNLLISSHGVPGTVIRVTQITQITNPEEGVIEAGTGVRLPHLARHAASLGLSGLEFAVGIPGCVGGGVVMNAGAHGSCLANIVESATVFDTRRWNTVTLSNAELGFRYRKSNIDPEQQIVLSARFRLTPEQKDKIDSRIRQNEEYRWRTQPLSWPSAGSTFKNPEPERCAGFLLDRAGAKQLREGKAAVSAVHANFVINMGGATSMEVTTLLSRMQDCVYKAFEVRLKPEWKRLGVFSPEEVEVWNGEA